MKIFAHGTRIYSAGMDRHAYQIMNIIPSLRRYIQWSLSIIIIKFVKIRTFH